VKPTARSIAARVLERVEADRAYAAATLDAEIERHPQLDARERALATELVYGTLRTRRVLTDRLERFAPRGLGRTDPQVRAHLLIAAYQILMLDRVPAFAAVDAAVGLARAARGAKMAGFANAVLRKLAAGGEHIDRAEAAVASAPEWLRARLERDVGAEEARALLGGDPRGAPVVAVRIRPGRAIPDWLDAAATGRVSPLARLLRGEGDPRKRPGFASGDFVVQEEGAQVVALALGVRPGERVLDACAGRGQKTSLFAEQLAGKGELFASDLHPAKLRALAEEHARLGLPGPATAAVDLTVGVGSLPERFDRVLVDAPCSGVGTLRRRPEILERLAPEDPARLSALGEAILRHAASRARAGGRVLYAVCSVLREEAEELVARVGDVLEPAPFDAPEVASVAGGATAFRLLPGAHGTDGYFLASFSRR
jgi:16S rRNA (cytosine967-C5)-methyltransferase